jgi:sugar transferase (PEP-CTERM/EpsH1 system associated)
VKVLFLAHRVPYPPNKGDKIRSFHELRALVARGHEVHLLAFGDDSHELRHRTVPADLCASVVIVPLDRQRARLRVLTGLLGQRPLTLRYFGAPGMTREVLRILAEVRPGAVVPFCSSMVQHVPGEWIDRSVVDLVDADSEKWRDYARHRRVPASWLYALEWRRLRRYERDILARAAHTVVSTEREASVLGAEGEGSHPRPVHVIPNGVDLAHYKPAASAAWLSTPTGPAGPSPLREPGVARYVFTGALDYYVNVEGVRYFAEEVFPLVRARVPRAELLIVGPNPCAAVRRLGRRAGVTVTGFVEDERPYLGAATACVAPLRLARGIQNKVLVAMAAGRAVIATPEAVAGLRVVAGRHVLVGRTTQDLVELAVSVATSAERRERLEGEARRFVETEHDWAPPMARFVDLVETVAAGAGSASRPLPGGAAAWRPRLGSTTRHAVRAPGSEARARTAGSGR